MSPVSTTCHSPDFPPTPLPTPSQVTSQAPLPSLQPPFKCQQFLPSAFFSPLDTFIHSCGFSCCPRLPHACLQPRSLHGIAQPNIQPPVQQPSAKLTMLNPELSPSPTCFSGILWLRERQHHPPGPQPAASSHPQLFPAPSPPHLIRLTDAPQHLSFPSPLPLIVTVLI